ncbi:hypothetical protein [Mucilaginibacter paludis]|uniref:Transmembrane protein n=1 Tax=Mucilaginibacter paludis DSM 18603 TaxID=714943 RepID=H1Y011_9SPHI|nr:hypothetical protein [Mucilaginibacter paludis]EHQ27853.1 hypothetical protein Mucpa_3755 [Mucilaginibacter paludis DSM 18603]
MKLSVFAYCFKVWLTSVLVAPLLFFKVTEILGRNMLARERFFDMYLIAVILCGVMSIITFIIFWLITLRLAKLNLTKIKRLIWVFVIGEILTVLTFGIFFMLMPQPSTLIMMWCVCLVIGCGILIYKLNPKINNESETDDTAVVTG